MQPIFAASRTVIRGLACALLALAHAVASADYVDDFTGGTLGAGWSVWDGYAVQNPSDSANHATFSVGDGHVSIAFPGVAEHNNWWVRHAQVMRTYSGSGTYEIKVDGGFNGSQQVGILFQRDPSSYMAFMLYATNQVYAYIERFSFVNGELHKSTVAGAPLGIAVPEPGPHYIRVTVLDNADPTQRSWRFDWSSNGTDWIEVFADTYEGAASSANIGGIQQVAIFAGNQPPDYSAYNARIDYFRYTATTPPNTATVQNLVGRPGNTTAELWWDPVPTALSYQVYRFSGGGSTLLGTTTTTTFTATGLANDTPHELFVVPVTNQGQGQSSTLVAVVPHAATAFQSLPTNGLLLALDADELAYVLTDGEPVTQWVSAAGAQTAASAPGNRAPTFVASAINGRSAVRFNGVDEYLSLPPGFQNFTAGASIYVVMSPTALQPGFKILTLGNGAGSENIVLGRAGSTNGLQYFTNNAAGSVDWFNTGSGLTTGNAFLVSLIQQAGSVGGTSFAEAFRNGTSVGGESVFVPPVATRSANHIGRSYWNDGMLQGDVANVLIYNRVLTGQEQATLHSLVSQSYGITISGSTPPQPPAAPATLSATGGNAVVNLAWSASSGATGYKVSRRTLPAGSFTVIASPATTSLADTAVANGTTYEYVVVASNAGGDSANSPVATATPVAPPPQPPVAPASISAVAGDTTVTVTWSASSGATGYSLSRRLMPSGSFAVVATTAGTSHVDQGLVNGSTYEYFVSASNNAGSSGPSTTVQGTPQAAPPAGPIPSTGLILRLNAASLTGQVSPGAAVTAWSDTSGANNNATALTNSAPTFQAAAIGGRPALRFDGVDDYYSLPTGFADFSSGVSFFIVMRPTTLQPGFKILTLGSGANQRNIVLGRAGTTSGLQYFTNNSSGSVGWFNTNSGLSTGEAMVVSVVQQGGAAGASTATTVARDGTAVGGNNVFVPPVLERTANYIGRSYWTEGWLHGDVAEVILYNRALSTAEQATVQAYITQTYGIGAPPPPPPVAPATLIAEADDAAIALGWSSSGGALGYRLYRRTPPSTTFSLRSDLTGTGYVDAGLSNGVTYEYVVTAYNAGGESSQSTIASATPEATPAPPSTPASLVAQASSTLVNLSWSAASGADGYRIYRRTPPSTSFALVTSTAGLTFADSGLTNGTTYEYTVTGYNAHGESGQSAIAAATPTAPPPAALPSQGLILSLDATALAGQLADGASVQVWADASGLGNHAAGSGSAAPTFVTASIGGKPAVRFDGVDDFLSLPSGFNTFTEGMSLYAVIRPSVLQPGFKLIALGNGANQQNIVLGRAGSSSGYQFFTDNASGGVAWFNTNAGLTSGESSLVSVSFDAGSANALRPAAVQRNGLVLGGADVYVPPVAARSVNYIGRSYWNEGRFQGDIAEIVIYNRKLSATEESSVEAYFAGKYQIVVQ